MQTSYIQASKLSDLCQFLPGIMNFLIMTNLYILQISSACQAADIF